MEMLVLLLSAIFGGLVVRAILEIRNGVPITRIFPDGNSATGIFLFNSFFGKLFLRGNFIAFAIGKYVVVKNKTLANKTIIHELRHVYQWQTLGFFRFIWEYLREQVKHGYTCNAFEEDARIAAEEPTRCSYITNPTWKDRLR
jgi:hypothetical protein